MSVLSTSLLRDLARQSLAGLRLLLVMTVITGIGYPVLIWVAAQPFGDRAAGEPVRYHGRVVGSALLGQSFTGPRWFHSRPSAGDDDTLASGASNLGPRDPDLLATIARRRHQVATTESVPPGAVPADAVTASASGLDPQISPAYAAIQVARVARVDGLDPAVVRRLVAAHTQGRFLGFHGQPAVDVLPLNVAVLEARAAGGS